MSEVITCAAVGDEAAEPIALLASLSQRKPIATTPQTVEISPLVTVLASGASVSVQYTYCRTASELLALNPKIVLACFSPVHPSTVATADKWSSEIDRLFPRPKVVAVGTRLELLGSRKVLDKMKSEGKLAVSPEDCVELASKLRAASYYEVSHATYTNVQALETGVCKAVVGEADKRPTRELAEDARAACIAAGSRMKRSVWIARRHKGNGRLFFFNTETRSSQWTRPKDYDGEEPELTEAERRAQEADMIVDEESRKRKEREQAVITAYLKEVEEHEQRMRDMESKSDTLTTSIAKLQAESERLRGVAQKNADERDVLENQRDEYVGASVDLTRSTPEDEAALEKELEDARARAFQLEAAAAMRLERDFDVQISEAVMRNRSLAARLRSVLQEQLETQKLGASTQAKRTATRRRLDDGARTLTRLQQKVSAVEQERALMDDKLRSTEGRLQHIQTEVSSLREKDTDSQLQRRDTLHQQKKLVEACEELDIRIAEMRKRTAASGNASAQQECQRLRLEQRTLIQKLAVAEAATSRADLQVRKLIIAHEHAATERRTVYDKLNSLAHRRVTLGQRQLQEFEAGLGYAGVTREELERLAHGVEGRSMRRSALATESQEVSSMLKAKLRLIDEEGTSLRNSAKEFAEFARMRRRDMEHEAKQEVQVTEWIVESFDALDESHASGASSVAKLVEKARSAVQSDVRLLDSLGSIFATELVSEPTITTARSSRMRRSELTAGSPSSSQLDATERSARKSYTNLARRVSKQFTADASPSRMH